MEVTPHFSFQFLILGYVEAAALRLIKEEGVFQFLILGYIQLGI